MRLINERRHVRNEIGKLKQQLRRCRSMSRIASASSSSNIARLNHGPLSQIQLRQVYERLIDVMRQVQTVEMAPAADYGSSRLAEAIELQAAPRDQMPKAARVIAIADGR